jgi:hypothetical protein
LAYYNERVLPLLQTAKSYTVATSYSFGDVQAENDLFKAALPLLKKLLTDGLAKEKKDLPLDATAFPLLRNALLAEDVAEIKANSLLELQLAEALPVVQEEYARGAIEDKTLEQTLGEYAQDHLRMKRGKELDAWVSQTLKNKEESLRLYAIQVKLSNAAEAEQRYQLDVTLQPGLSQEAMERYLPEGDKAAILAELAKAKEYVLVSDYEIIPEVAQPDPAAPEAELPKTYAITYLVDNTSNRLVEVRFTARYELTAELQGTGTLASEGSFTAAAPLEKTVKLTFNWPATEGLTTTSPAQ